MQKKDLKNDPFLLLRSLSKSSWESRYRVFK